ncbi:serine/threonine-protein phosphatase 7 long form isoform X1 [Cinnamomum micranthum f. kanehirae]|uniref:Serine/threonine-protein phosphatase 7 long form isoform X1 n=1 Tax=Cinnamomum micranthum f. kanehirae TaxID=337451 RepID=A0A443Q2M3_9MAGN|nr:serine/threonine-protein phosphatase 7 long form isoform X1 [Cinnamomum micranthum f. kanehirae]
MDRPSSSRLRPTASNKRHRQRIEEVVEEVQEWVALKCLSHRQKIPHWQLNESGRFRELVDKSNLSPLITASYRSASKILVSCFVERWQPETNTFHMPFGEMSISLDDVVTILGILVSSRSVPYSGRMSFQDAHSLPVDTLGVDPNEANDELQQIRGQSVRLEWLRGRFSNITDEDGNDMIDYAVRAYLLYLLGCTLFTDKTGTCVPIMYLTLLTNLERVRTYAWDAAALAYLYRQLGLATRHEVKQIAGYLKLLEAWIYEHFECLASTLNIHYGVS